MPGEIMPAGECPHCGALCHSEATEDNNTKEILFNALLTAYGALCARMDPHKPPRMPVDWKTLDHAAC